MKNIILSFILLFLGYAVNAQITDSSYRTKVQKLMDIQTGQGMMFEQVVKQILPNIPEDKQEEFKKDLKMIFEKSMDQVTDVYMEVSTKEEVDAWMEFYNSPIGQQILAKLPEIMEKSMKTQQDLQMEIMPLLQKYMK